MAILFHVSVRYINTAYVHFSFYTLLHAPCLHLSVYLCLCFCVYIWRGEKTKLLNLSTDLTFFFAKTVICCLKMEQLFLHDTLLWIDCWLNHWEHGTNGMGNGEWGGGGGRLEGKNFCLIVCFFILLLLLFCHHRKSTSLSLPQFVYASFFFLSFKTETNGFLYSFFFLFFFELHLFVLHHQRHPNHHRSQSSTSTINNSKEDVYAKLFF